MNAHKNAARFEGFADTYHSARPSCPAVVTDILMKYLGGAPETVVDIGCGTGLSTLIWADIAGRVIGVEPSDDMRAVAVAASGKYHNVEYIKAFSNDTGLETEMADIITCSQSFHWMEPVSTLSEVNRLLKPDGVFAAYDCDWPPVCSAEVELEYNRLFDKVREIEDTDASYKSAFVRFPKDKHLESIRRCGHFRYTRELVFMNAEPCSADRYIRIAVSQGGLQAILKREPERITALSQAFRVAVENDFGGGTKEILFCYRMRMGVK